MGSRNWLVRLSASCGIWDVNKQPLGEWLVRSYVYVMYARGCQSSSPVFCETKSGTEWSSFLQVDNTMLFIECVTEQGFGVYCLKNHIILHHASTHQTVNELRVSEATKSRFSCLSLLV